MASQLNKYTSLPRPLDFNYPGNTFIGIFALVVFVGGSFLQSMIFKEELSSSLIWSFEAALSVFLTWAIAREIDPDHNSTAILASLLQALNLLVVTRVNILYLFLILLLTRILSRTTGINPTIIDSSIVTLLAVVVTFFYNFAAALVAAVAFFLEGLLPGRHIRQFIFSLALLIITFVAYDSANEYELNIYFMIIAIVTALLFSVSIILVKNIKTKTDYTNEAIMPVRVQASQFIVLIAGLLNVIYFGDTGYSGLSALWAVMASAVVIRIITLFNRKF